METLRKISNFVVSEKYIPYVEGMFYSVTGRIYQGEPLVCPCCEGHFKQFMPFRGKINSRCPGCGSLKRHRLIWLYLKERTHFFSAPLTVLHFAPEYLFQKVFEKMPNLDYFSADWASPRSRIKMDITNITYEADTFDAIITNHVLEHVTDDVRAMSELRRVLKPGGFAILQSPVNRNFEKTYEDPSVTSPKDRKRAFGQEDHVRIYGRDYKNRLEQAGFTVKLDNFAHGLGLEKIRRHVLPAEEPVYYCTK
jgi:SAM-dependent methyltransferase